jgi:NADH:ubiquinone oxidoreductase subunit E
MCITTREDTRMIEINVCIGSSCHLKGSYNIIQTFQQLVEENALHERIEMKAQFCMKQCQRGVSVAIGDEIFSVSPETAREFFRNTIMARLGENLTLEKGVNEV